MVLSWTWLVVGIVTLGFFLIIGPNALAAVGQQQAKPPPEALLFIQVFTGGILGCVYILLPGAFLLFYQRYATWATCQWRDPQPRWTDRCPLPVLALSIVYGFSALQMPASLVYGGVLPFFGMILSGPAGVTAMLLLAAFMAWLAWGMYRLKFAAWWAALVFLIVGGISTALTFAQPNAVKTMYEKMNLPPAQLDMMNKMGLVDFTSRIFAWIMPVCAVVMLGYLIWVRRYFRGEVDKTVI